MAQLGSEACTDGAATGAVATTAALPTTGIAIASAAAAAAASCGLLPSACKAVWNSHKAEHVTHHAVLLLIYHAQDCTERG